MPRTRNDPGSQRPRASARIKLSHTSLEQTGAELLWHLSLTEIVCPVSQSCLLRELLHSFPWFWDTADFYSLFSDTKLGWNQCASKNSSKNYVNNRGRFPTYTQNCLHLPLHSSLWEGCNFELKLLKVVFSKELIICICGWLCFLLRKRIGLQRAAEK